ncbi:nSTAND1 domain-containing NTPase [Nonomuraea sediminis]|uniref:nSTAND1 domain-containing NTPase n=1 Tax=Nonomuraea sediminis TaxID=2835864 RepID=UPI001BDCC2C8|nr:hypothetical protein [Nonomuraea sediminis]
MTDRLGGYWLGARLGSGEVFEAYDESGQRRALRALPVDSDAAKAALQVHSLHVADLVEVATTYLVSEYVEGMSLRRVVDEHGPYAVGDLYRLATATATALAAIHEAGAVHGSLDPGRVLLTDSGPRLIGLGVASGEPADDVYAWGQVLLYAARGAEPLDRQLRGLAAAATSRDPRKRPGARQLLLSLLDAPQSQQGRLLPPEPVHDPGLGGLAEEVFLGLSHPDQGLVPEIFLRLVTTDASGCAPVPLDELLSGRTPDQVASLGRILTAYGEATLLSVPPDDAEGGTVEVVWPALLWAWPRLREWAEAERVGLAVHRDLARAARRWEGGGRRDAELYRGERLRQALAWAASGRRHLTLNADEQRFIDAGIAAGRRRGRLAVLAAVVSVALVAAGVAIWQSGSAEDRLDHAMARVAASRAEAVRLADPVLARELSLAAWSLAPVTEARRALARSDADAAVGVFTDPHANDRSVYAISDDGGRLAALTDGTLRVYDLRTGAEIAQSPGPEQSVRAMAWSPVSDTLALVGVDRTYLWSSASGMGPAFGRGLGAPGQQTAWFSPGGGLLFAAARQSGERWVWDLRMRRSVYADDDVVVGPRDAVALEFAGKGSSVRRYPSGARTAAPWLDRMPWEYTVFAPDGERVAIAEETGVQVYRLDGVPVLPVRLRPSPGALRFSADGQLLASTDNDRLRVWRLADGALVADRQVPTAADRPAQARLDASGRWLRVLAGRGTVLTIDLAHAASPVPPEQAAATICTHYGPFTESDWNHHLPEVPYHPLCPHD